MPTYKLLSELYPAPCIVKGYNNDGQCWCFQQRFLRVFSKEFPMTLTDQYGIHLVAPENEEICFDFSEALVLSCKTYSDDSFVHGAKPNPSKSHKIIVRYFPNRSVDQEEEENKSSSSDGKTRTVLEYPETVFLIYPSKRVQSLVEWYVDNARSPSKGRNLYSYNVKEEYWMRRYQYVPLEETHVYGLDDKFQMFERDFNIIHQKIDLLHKVGKSCSLNYFLHGLPGIGKSSFARAVATKYNLDIYTANLKDCKHIKDSDSVKTILTPRKMIFKEEKEKQPKGDSCCGDEGEGDECYDEFESICNPGKHEYIVVLIEDFDRYLESCNSEEMSNILNSIDGVEPSDGVIRFFSANNTEDIKLNKAFLSRMNGIWRFELNNRESILKRVSELFTTPVFAPGQTEKSAQELYADKACEYKLSLREITNHLCRYLMDEVNGVIDALGDVERFVQEKDIKVENDAVVLNSGEEAEEEALEKRKKKETSE